MEAMDGGEIVVVGVSYRERRQAVVMCSSQKRGDLCGIVVEEEGERRI
jgi:lysophospholipid acyltransferase (LPLAT)-like uncharacterized protein